MYKAPFYCRCLKTDHKGKVIRYLQYKKRVAGGQDHYVSYEREKMNTPVHKVKKLSGRLGTPKKVEEDLKKVADTWHEFITCN